MKREDIDISVGDTVRVTSNCQSNGKVGVVKRILSANGYWHSRHYYAQVKFPNRNDCIKFNVLSLKKISPYSEKAIEANEKTMNKNKKENNNMALNGDYVVAVVKFVDGYNTNKSYNFAYYDNDEDVICIGDRAIVNSKISGTKYSVVEVIGIAKKEDVPPVTDEIICKVSFDNYNKRKVQRAEKEKIHRQMDAIARENQEFELYQMIAEKSPKMAELLAMYKNIGNV